MVTNAYSSHMVGLYIGPPVDIIPFRPLSFGDVITETYLEEAGVPFGSLDIKAFI